MFGRRLELPTIQALFNSALCNNRDIAHVLETTPFKENKEYALHSSGMYTMDAITNAVDRMFSSEDQWVTRDGIELWYCCFDDVCLCSTISCQRNHYSEADIEEDMCKNMTRGILWLLLYKHVPVTLNHLKHIRLKPLYQRLYEIDTKQHIVPEFVYRYMRVIEWVMRKLYSKQRQYNGKNDMTIIIRTIAHY